MEFLFSFFWRKKKHFSIVCSGVEFVPFHTLLVFNTGRALGNLGLSHESLGNFEKAIAYQEQHLSIAAQINDKTAKTLAYSSLGEYPTK